MCVYMVSIFFLPFLSVKATARNWRVFANQQIEVSAKEPLQDPCQSLGTSSKNEWIDNMLHDPQEALARCGRRDRGL
jgi:hypothetical protein